MMLQNLQGEISVLLGQRFLGTGLRNVGVAMIVLTAVLFYATGLFDKVYGRKENKGY